MSTHYRIIDADENFKDCWRPVAEHAFVAADGTWVQKDEVGGICGKTLNCARRIYRGLIMILMSLDR